MNRGQHYGMNFYLHEEIKDWNQESLGKAYVLTDVPRCRNLTPVPFACEPVPFNEEQTGVFLYHILMGGSRQGSRRDRKSTRLNSSHGYISYAVFCLKKKKTS